MFETLNWKMLCTKNRKLNNKEKQIRYQAGVQTVQDHL